MKSKIVKMFTAQDNLQEEMVIEAFKEDLGNTGIMNLYGDNSNFGENIYVSEENAEKAAEILIAMGLERASE